MSHCRKSLLPPHSSTTSPTSLRITQPCGSPSSVWDGRASRVSCAGLTHTATAGAAGEGVKDKALQDKRNNSYKMHKNFIFLRPPSTPANLIEWPVAYKVSGEQKLTGKHHDSTCLTSLKNRLKRWEGSHSPDCKWFPVTGLCFCDPGHLICLLFPMLSDSGLAATLPMTMTQCAAFPVLFYETYHLMWLTQLILMSHRARKCKEDVVFWSVQFKQMLEKQSLKNNSSP